MTRYKFSPNKIYNLDGTSNFIIPVLPNSSVLRESSKWGVRHLKERWINVTMITVVNAT
jgi:hypothetical protein